jgi:hypothetical protein
MEFTVFEMRSLAEFTELSTRSHGGRTEKNFKNDLKAA